MGYAPHFGGPRPKIITLCGSTRFYDEFQQANAQLTIEGHLVISVGVWVRSSPAFADLPAEEREALKIMLDELHKRKIDLADEIFVVNVGGYIGESTASEVAYAYAHGKIVRYLEPSS